MRNHIEVNRLTYLPYHFLLVSVGNAGYLKYQVRLDSDLRRNFPFLNQNGLFRHDAKECNAQQRRGK
jgi:hypothetical protein